MVTQHKSDESDESEQNEIALPEHPDPEWMIRFDKVVKQFGDLVVLRELDFRVRPAERVALIGPSGSGKTTILRLLMGLERASGGRIQVDDEFLTHMRRRDRLVPADDKHIRRVRTKVGMVFQQFNLFPNLNVLRNITLAPLRVLGKSREEAEEHGRHLLELVGLEEKADEHPTRLSGGQQQRVAIARALAMEPEVLLLDEVTSALDPEAVTGVLNLLRDIAKTTDLTILVVTHEMTFARDIAGRVLMFDSGQVVEEGPPEQMFGQPSHERTQEFLRTTLED